MIRIIAQLNAINNTLINLGKTLKEGMVMCDNRSGDMEKAGLPTPPVPAFFDDLGLPVIRIESLEARDDLIGRLANLENSFPVSMTLNDSYRPLAKEGEVKDEGQ